MYSTQSARRSPHRKALCVEQMIGRRRTDLRDALRVLAREKLEDLGRVVELQNDFAIAAEGAAKSGCLHSHTNLSARVTTSMCRSYASIGVEPHVINPWFIRTMPV